MKMTEEIIKHNNAEIENKDPVASKTLNEYERLEQKLTNYDNIFVKDFIRNIKSISLLVNSKDKGKILDSSQITNLLEYANFGIDISPKAGMLYYFSRGGQFGFLTPRAIIELLGKTGVNVTCDVICGNDQFKVDPANLKISHVLGLPRGDTLGVYAVFRQSGKIISIEVLDILEIEKIKKIAINYNKSSIWENHFNEMARKTVIKRGAKRLPMLENNLKQALEVDNKEFSEPTTDKINNVAVTTQPERI